MRKWHNSRVTSYLDRQHHEAFMSTRGGNKYVCLNCMNPTVTFDKCSNCGSTEYIKTVSIFARIPKIGSSKLKWKIFCKLFFGKYDFEQLWKSRRRK